MKKQKPFKYWFLPCDPVGIQTQDLQNRNLTLYSAKLRSRYYAGKGRTKFIIQ